MKYLMVLLLSSLSMSVLCQVEDCNKLGAWLWHLERTSEATHAGMAARLADLGMKRVYVKVSDGRIDTIRWDEMVDEGLVEDYKSEELEVWGWSYNYLANDSLQAEALYQAAKTGYDGYVVDVEIEFDGNPLGLFNLFYAFDQAKQRAVQDGYITDDFPVYCTTWGNPKDHNYAISVIDPYVDAFMPQTYVEQWGIGYVTNLEHWIERGNQEYEELGATKPVHHILAMYDDIVDHHDANRFFNSSGPESSIWRVPGGGVSERYWQEWEDIEWDMDFCEATSIVNSDHVDFKIYPNPVSDILSIKTNSAEASDFTIINSTGQIVSQVSTSSIITNLDVSELGSGIYYLKPRGKLGPAGTPFVKF